MTAASSTTTLPPAPEPLTDALPWLKSLPLAPTYYPTIAEFEDPIGYIFKIEKEAAQFGICKIVPPLPPPPKKTAIAYLNRSLASRDGGKESGPGTFTTRQQQIGFCARRSCPVKRPVWQSGEEYTVQEFEVKAKGFEKHYLKKWPKGKAISALEMETLFWKANADKPFRVEYANDMPGSAFVPIDMKKKCVSVEGSGGGGNVGDSSWNMRGVSRAKGSLLKYMKEEIPGVTSPMLYIAMMFSWFAWHVEDHDLHSLNYLHMGAGKTWYGVPREAAVAFEEVVRVHGYGEEVNALGTFAALGEKTTVISPKVFMSAGVPCCRLVQYAGEFVVTFPRAYHSGFSHGFNCGEASNIATPEWLRVAKDAAIRRASINLPPMVSHFQLLYELALSLCSRIPAGETSNPRSLRLKDKKKNEGETLIKELFVQNAARNNDLLHILAKGSSVVLLPQSSSESSVYPSIQFRSQLSGYSRLPFRICSPSKATECSNDFVSYDDALKRIQESKKGQAYYTVKEDHASHCGNSRIVRGENKGCATASHTLISGATSKMISQSDRMSNQRLFSCVTCGILTFDCLAIIQPKAPAARFLMSADCSIINDLINSGFTGVTVDGLEETTPEQSSPAGIGTNARDGLYSISVPSADLKIQSVDKDGEMFLDSRSCKDNSALGLLATTYGNSSDDEDEQTEPGIADSIDNMMLRSSTPEIRSRDDCPGPSFRPGWHIDSSKLVDRSLSTINHDDKVLVCADAIEKDVFEDNVHQTLSGNDLSLVVHDTGSTRMYKRVLPAEETNMFVADRFDEGSCRKHVFCLEHALEVERWLRQIGGAHIILFCHPDYPQIEAEARIMAKEIGIDCSWNKISFRDSTIQDKDQIQMALDSEEAIPGNGDWTVKPGINLFYSANLSRSSVYSKQMPYNSVIYNAFGHNTSASSPTKSDAHSKRSRRKKKVVAGKWCGKVWMSNQVHPFLVDLDDEDGKGDRKFHSWEACDEIEMRERKPEKNHNSRANAVSKRSGKRKIIVGNDTNSGTSLNDHNYKRQKTVIRALPTGYDERGETSSADSPESSLPNRSLLKGKKSAAFSNDLDENSLQQLWQKSKLKQLKCSAGMNANDSMSNSSSDGCRKSSRTKMCKYVGSDDAIAGTNAISDDSMGNSNSERHGKNTRSKMFKYVGSDDANSDDSFTLYSENSRGKRARNIQRKNLSEDSMDSPHFRTPRGSTHFESSLREDTDSDDILSDGSHLANKNFRGRRSKYIEKRDAVLDDYKENNSKKISRKQTNSVCRQDLISDGSSEDNSCQQNIRSVRKKKTKSGKLQEQKQKNTQQNKPSATRRKQGTTSQMTHEASVQKESAYEEELESGPNTRLRTRSSKKLKDPVPKLPIKKLAPQKSVKKAAIKRPGPSAKSKDEENEYPCDIEGCAMSFGSKRELLLHKKNICPVKGCQKKFFSHKYLVQHRKVHLDDRPLKCPWKGCEMTFKWPWARTEHIRVHTGARPYVCTESGCGQTFRFVSDFSRHKRKTGHSAKKGRG